MVIVEPRYVWAEDRVAGAARAQYLLIEQGVQPDILTTRRHNTKVTVAHAKPGFGEQWNHFTR